MKNRENNSTFDKTFPDNFSSLFNDELTDVMATVEWDKNAVKITDNVFSLKEKKREKRVIRLRYCAGFAASLIILFAGIIIGRFISVPSDSGEKSLIKRDYLSLHRIDQRVKDRELADYMRDSRCLLTELTNSTEPQSAVLYGDRGVLKRMLRKNRLIKAGNSIKKSEDMVIEKIRWILLEALSEEEVITPESMNRVKLYIEREKLLLKIKLIEKELDQRSGEKVEGGVM